MVDNLQARAALRMIREAIETYGPPGILQSEEVVTAYRGPELTDEAAAIVDAIKKLATIMANARGNAA